MGELSVYPNIGWDDCLFDDGVFSEVVRLKVVGRAPLSRLVCRDIKFVRTLVFPLAGRRTLRVGCRRWMGFTGLGSRL